MNFPWDLENEELLMRMYHEGSTCTEIAKVLAKQYGFVCSRSAIIGKIHRLLAAKKLNRIAKPAAPKVPKQAKPEPVQEPARKPTNPPPLKHFPRVQTQTSVKGVPQGPLPFDLPERKNENAIALLDLQIHHCRYPLDDEEGRTFFCGKVKLEDSSYCPEHHARCRLKAVPVATLLNRKPKRFEGGRFGF